VTAKLALPGTGRNQGSEGDRGVPATECGRYGLHGLGEGSGERVPFFAAWCFPVPGQGLVGIAHRVPHWHRKYALMTCYASPCALRGHWLPCPLTHEVSSRHLYDCHLIVLLARIRSGRLLRLRRTAHKHHRRGTCRSPCPQSLRSFAGSTPSGGYRPRLRRLPQCFPQAGCFRARKKKALAQERRSRKEQRDSDREACFAGNWPQPSREDGAECCYRQNFYVPDAKFPRLAG
jgi:hypothetical protein